MSGDLLLLGTIRFWMLKGCCLGGIWCVLIALFIYFIINAYLVLKGVLYVLKCRGLLLLHMGKRDACRLDD